MMKQATLAAVLAVFALGCSHDGASPDTDVPSPDIPQVCVGVEGNPDAVRDNILWHWCDGSTPGQVCAADYPIGQEAEYCFQDESPCKPVRSDGETWERFQQGAWYDSGECLAPNAGTRLWIR